MERQKQNELIDLGVPEDTRFESGDEAEKRIFKAMVQAKIWPGHENFPNSEGENEQEE